MNMKKNGFGRFFLLIGVIFLLLEYDKRGKEEKSRGNHFLAKADEV